MTLAEFKKLTKGATEISLSPLEWDELKPHADADGTVVGVRIVVDPIALAKWEQARIDDAQREIDRRAALANAAEVAAKKDEVTHGTR